MTINTFHRIARQRWRKRRGEELGCIFVRFPTESKVSTLKEARVVSPIESPPPVPFARSSRREKFSRCEARLFSFLDGEISLRDFPNNNSHATIEGGIFSTVSTIRIESFLPLLRSIPCTNETFVRIIAWNSPLRSDKEVEGKREGEG